MPSRRAFIGGAAATATGVSLGSGLLVAGELPGAPIIGELIPRGDSVLIIR